MMSKFEARIRLEVLEMEVFAAHIKEGDRVGEPPFPFLSFISSAFSIRLLYMAFIVSLLPLSATSICL